jgi:phosphate transport system substrate-binding protein
VFKKVVGKICTEQDCENYQIIQGVNKFLCDQCGKRLVNVVETDKKRIAFFGSILVMAILVLFAATNGIATTVDSDTLFVMHGSNTIGNELAPALAEAYLKKLGGKEVKTIALDQNNIEKQVQAILPGKETPQKIIITAHGSSTAFEGLQKGICDIGMSSRKIKAQEVDLLKNANLGDFTLVGSENILGLDGIAIIINASQTITKLSKEDIAKIFTGQIADWSLVGGKPGPIHVYSRDNNSGTYDTFSSLVLNSQKLIGSAKKYENSEMLSQDISQDPAGIGFIGLPYIGSTHAVAVAEADAAALIPSQFTVATEDYPLSRRLFLYLSQNSKNKAARDFISFCLSSEGQDIVTKLGFVAQNIDVKKISGSNTNWLNQEKKKQYQTIIAGCQGRFSLNFRFKPNSIILDNKALTDVDRLVQFLSTGNNQNSRIVLVGFADSAGDYEANAALSEQRAFAVREQMSYRSKDLASRIDVVGFGQEEALAANGTPEGREKNRRVEVWLRN